MGLISDKVDELVQAAQGIATHETMRELAIACKEDREALVLCVPAQAAKRVLGMDGSAVELAAALRKRLYGVTVFIVE